MRIGSTRWRLAVRGRIRGFIEEMLEAELDVGLAARPLRPRTADGAVTAMAIARVSCSAPSARSRYRSRARVWPGRMAGTSEWRNQTLPAYRRLTMRAEALIAGAYLAGTNTRRVRRALGALFGGAIGKDMVSRAWHKVQTRLGGLAEARSCRRTTSSA